MGEVLLKMTGIIRDFQNGEETNRVLKGIDLTVEKGEFLAILGPSGSGKSTLMNIIGLLDTPTDGEYILDGEDVRKLDESQLAHLRNQEIGFIFQQYFLLPRLSAQENVMIPLFYADMKESDQRKRSAEVLTKVGLGEKLNHYPSQLSGGLQQRVAIARALAPSPSLLLADEPTGALDQITGRQIIELFKQLNNEGVTVIMITHDANIAAHAKRMVKIVDGNLSEGELKDA